ncbi:sigma-70 family RNA polymerase sigma factor [Nocardiopsis sp. CC223A]|uniref:sigma-70 family RNA polymerase sigma factor n=1 Tax=Nocardiopsis sp. CC223A TaxID=3044051 RepID=UPI00278C6E43|nr:sigma-70 family RNA polymerase sigma factor [Nocardiopsis sp. CC223A]
MRELFSAARRFEEHRPRLRAVAHRMLGSVGEADDAVQETWLRLERTGIENIDDLGGWTTTVTARVCLNMLRSREQRREEPLETGGPWGAERLPDPVVGSAAADDPESAALTADSVGWALMVVVQELNPSERVAFVLHDLFAVPYAEIGPLVERGEDAARQLASRARRRVREQGSRGAVPDGDPARRRRVVDAFFAAAREGDIDGLLSVLHPEVVLRSDGGVRGRYTTRITGAADVAGQAVTFHRFAPFVHPVSVNGAEGVVVTAGGRVLSVMGFVVAGGRITAIDVLADPDRLAELGITPEALGIREG